MKAKDTRKKEAGGMRKVTVWVATGKSVSGDDYGPFVFLKKPTDTQLGAFWQDYCAGGDYDPEEPGPGDYGTYVSTRLDKCDAIDPWPSP